MSGPKVVRIVTREEILEICLGLLAQVEAALAEWERIGTKNNVIDAQDRVRRAGEIKQLKALIEKDHFMELQKRAPLLLHSLRIDMSQRLEAMHSAAATARRRENSLRHAARQLQRQLQTSGTALPDGLRAGLDTAASNRPLQFEELQKIVANALRAFPEPISDSKTDQKELIQQLQQCENSPTLDDWLNNLQPAPIASAIQTLDRYLAQLAGCDESEQLEELTKRAAKASSETDDNRRRMLLDSLCVEAASAVRRAQRRMQYKHIVADERAAAAASGDMHLCAEIFQQLELQLDNDEFAGIQTSLDRIKQLRAEKAQVRAAEAGRAALLGGLKELGYQVKEGMSVAWTENKRLVVRHPTMSSVAVELGGVNEQNQFQARVVAIQGQQRNAKDDKQTETAWCGELSKIQARIRAAGGELNIDRALPAGSQPLKTVVLEQVEDEEEFKPQVRHLK